MAQKCNWDGLVAAAWPETTPASDGGEIAVAQPPRLEIWRGETQCRETSDGRSFTRS
jgi:hypothetical protein